MNARVSGDACRLPDRALTVVPKRLAPAFRFDAAHVLG
jgi:hypothetical protein